MTKADIRKIHKAAVLAAEALRDAMQEFADDARARPVREATIRLACVLDAACSTATDKAERADLYDRLDIVSDWLDGDAFEKAAPFHAAAMKREREDRMRALLNRAAQDMRAAE